MRQPGWQALSGLFVQEIRCREREPKHANDEDEHDLPFGKINHRQVQRYSGLLLLNFSAVAASLVRVGVLGPRVFDLFRFR